MLASSYALGPFLVRWTKVCISTAMPPDSWFEYLSAADLPVPDEQSVWEFHAWCSGTYGIDLPLEVATEMFTQLRRLHEGSRRKAHKKEWLREQIEKQGIDSLTPDEKELWAALHPDRQ